MTENKMDSEVASTTSTIQVLEPENEVHSDRASVTETENDSPMPKIFFTGI